MSEGGIVGRRGVGHRARSQQLHQIQTLFPGVAAPKSVLCTAQAKPACLFQQKIVLPFPNGTSYL